MQNLLVVNMHTPICDIIILPNVKLLNPFRTQFKKTRYSLLHCSFNCEMSFLKNKIRKKTRKKKPLGLVPNLLSYEQQIAKRQKVCFSATSDEGLILKADSRNGRWKETAFAFFPLHSFKSEKGWSHPLSSNSKKRQKPTISQWWLVNVKQIPDKDQWINRWVKC